MPQLTNAVAPARTSRSAAFAAAFGPMPLTAANMPSPSFNNPSLRLAEGPRVRASAPSAATTPATLNEWCRGA